MGFLCCSNITLGGGVRGVGGCAPKGVKVDGDEACRVEGVMERMFV